MQGNGGKKQEEPQSPKSNKSGNAKRSESKLTTFELYAKFFNERRIGEEQKLIRPIRDGRLRLNNTRLQNCTTRQSFKAAKNFKKREVLVNG